MDQTTPDKLKQLFLAAGIHQSQVDKLTNDFYSQCLLEALSFLLELHDKPTPSGVEIMDKAALESELSGFDEEEVRAAIAQASIELCYDWLSREQENMSEEQQDKISRLIEEMSKEGKNE